MIEWLNFYRVKSVFVVKAYRMEVNRALRLDLYARKESQIHGRKISHSAIIQTLLDKDPGFRRTRLPEQEAHANKKNDTSKDNQANK